MSDYSTFMAWPRRLLQALMGSARMPLQTLPAPWTQVVAPVEGGEENLLHKSQLREDLRVDFERWQFSFPTPGGPDVLQLFLDERLDNPVAEKAWTAAIAPEDLFVLLDRRYLTAGQHTLRYRVTLGASGVSSSSERFAFLVDPTVPDLDEEDDRLVLSPPATDGITVQYLEANGDQVGADVPDYWPIRVGDAVTWYWETRAEGRLVMGTHSLSLSDIGLPLTLSCPGDLVRLSGDGERYLTYDVTSRAGYQSQLSRYVLLAVNTTPVPRYFPAPTLAYAGAGAVSGALEPLLALEGVDVVIAAEAVFHAGEWAVVQWALGAAVGATEVSVDVSGQGPWRARIAVQYIGAHMGKTLQVQYRLRGDDALAPSAALNVRVAMIAQTSFPKVESRAAGANPGIVSLARVPAQGDELRVPRWPLIARDQRIKLWAAGTLNNGMAATGWVINDQALSSGQAASGVVGMLPRTWLATLRPNSSLSLRASVSFDEGSSWTDLAPTYLTFTL